MLYDLCRAARAHVEQVTGRSLGEQTLRTTFDRFPRGAAFPLPRGPLVSVTEITYVDADGTAKTMDAGDYTATADTIFAVDGWPEVQCGKPGSVSVTYVCGEDAPAPLLLAMKYLVSHWYNNRDAVLIGSISKPLEFTIDSLVWPYRTWYRTPE